MRGRVERFVRIVNGRRNALVALSRSIEDEIDTSANLRRHFGGFRRIAKPRDQPALDRFVQGFREHPPCQIRTESATALFSLDQFFER